MPKKASVKAVPGEEDPPPPKLSRRDPGPPSPLDFSSPASLFRSLLQPLDPQTFLQDFWEKKPVHLQRSDPPTASYYRSLFQLSDLAGLCSQGLQFYRDVNVVRCVNRQKKVLNKEGRVKHAVLNKILLQNKATIQFHQPQRFKDELWRIQERLESFFGALVGSNVYITPEESQGLPAHCDDVEVFVLQLEGQKRWRLYSPTVTLATEYSVEPEDRIGSPTHDIILQEGDLLYFPRGTIHQAQTPPGVHHSTHLTLSTYQRMSWGDLLLDAFPSMLCECSRTDVSLREGIPPRLLLGGGEDTHLRLAAHLRSLAEAVAAGGVEPRCSRLQRDFIVNRLPPFGQQAAPEGGVPGLDDVVGLRFKEHMVVTLEPPQQRTEDTAEPVVLVLHSLKNQRESHMMGEGDEEEDQQLSRGLQFPLSHLRALQQLQQEEKVPVVQLQLPSQEEKLSLVLALWSESLLVAL